MIVPIFDEDPNRQPLDSIIIMTINAEDYLYPLLTAWPLLQSTTESMLIRPENNHVLFLNPLRFNPDATLTLTASPEEIDLLAVKAITGPSGVFEGLNYRWREVI